MADHLSAEQRSWNMSKIRSTDTSIELLVRKYLFKSGYRYRKNVVSLPGKPDIVLKKYKTVIFIHGCFWHRHSFCKYATFPKTNVEYWQAKFDRNVSNDKKHFQQLEELGWNVVVIWECELKKDSFDNTMQRVINDLNSNFLNNLIRDK